jgi:hypothetical protein
MTWKLHYGMPYEALGFLPGIINDTDPRPVKEQVAEKYAHGGGWNPMPQGRFKLRTVGGKPVLQYPEDPPLRMWAEIQIRDEHVMVFESDWLVVVQQDGSFEASRID